MKYYCSNAECEKVIDELVTCDECERPFYCSLDCSKRDWTQCHQFFCPATANLRLSDFMPAQAPGSVGKGAYGMVSMRVHKQTGQRFALKTIPKASMGGAVERVHAEVNIHNVTALLSMEEIKANAALPI